MRLQLVLHWVGLIVIGLAIGHRFGAIEGLAASFAVWLLMPYHPRS